MVQAARWQRGSGHKRIDPIPPQSMGSKGSEREEGELSVPFHQKLAREKAKRLRMSQSVSAVSLKKSQLDNAHLLDSFSISLLSL